MRYDSDHKARTRATVLAKAAAAIREDGPDRLGIAGVMAEAGLTHGGFYAHFASRDDLLACAVGHMLDERYATFFSEVDDVEPRGALDHFIDRYLSLQHCHRRDTGCPLPILASGLHRLPPAARARFSAGVERLERSIATLLRRAGVSRPRAQIMSAIAEMVGSIALARTMIDDAVATDLLASAKISVRRKLAID